jgi:hypothetical protein
MFFDIDTVIFQNLYGKLKNFISLLSFKKLSLPKDQLKSNYLDNILKSLKFFYLKGGFVLSIIVLVLALLDTFIFHKL